jgi:hypothetical protein
MKPGPRSFSYSISSHIHEVIDDDSIYENKLIKNKLMKGKKKQ